MSTSDRGGGGDDAKGDAETFHEDRQWHTRVEGEGGILSAHGDKESAIEAGCGEARRRELEHIIKNLHGTIGERHSYGNDPRDIPG